MSDADMCSCLPPNLSLPLVMASLSSTQKPGHVHPCLTSPGRPRASSWRACHTSDSLLPPSPQHFPRPVHTAGRRTRQELHMIRSGETKSLLGLGTGRGNGQRGAQKHSLTGRPMRIKAEKRPETTPGSWAWRPAGGESRRNGEQVCSTRVCG